jgi:hypothetical protein
MEINFFDEMGQNTTKSFAINYYNVNQTLNNVSTGI